MTSLETVLDEAGLTNPKLREFVKEHAELTGAERVEVVNASDDARLVEEALAAGEREEFIAVLAAFVAINTMVYVTLAVAKILPKVYVRDLLDTRNRRSETRSIDPDAPV